MFKNYKSSAVWCNYQLQNIFLYRLNSQLHSGVLRSHIILGIASANERRRFISWPHTQDNNEWPEWRCDMDVFFPL